MVMHTRIQRSEDDDDTERGLYQSGLLRTRRHLASKKCRVTLTLLIIFLMLAIVGGCVAFTVLSSVEIKTTPTTLAPNKKETMQPTMFVSIVESTTQTPAPIRNETMQPTVFVSIVETTTTTPAPIRNETMQPTSLPMSSVPFVVTMQNETMSLDYTY